MSFLRLGHPGLPTKLIDEGPSTGRIHFTRYGTQGGGPPTVFGAFPTGVSSRAEANRQTREYKARKTQRQRERRAAG